MQHKHVTSIFVLSCNEPHRLGGGGTPLYGLYRCVQLKGVWIFSHFGQ